MTEEELQNVPQMISTKIATQQQLIQLLYSQVVDLTMMSKIELGDDVIAEIKRLQDIIGLPTFKEGIKLNSNNEIIIHNVEEKGRSVFDILTQFTADFPLHRGAQILPIEIEKWIEENL